MQTSFWFLDHVNVWPFTRRVATRPMPGHRRRRAGLMTCDCPQKDMCWPRPMRPPGRTQMQGLKAPGQLQATPISPPLTRHPLSTTSLFRPGMTPSPRLVFLIVQQFATSDGEGLSATRFIFAVARGLPSSWPPHLHSRGPREARSPASHWRVCPFNRQLHARPWDVMSPDIVLAP